MREESNLTSDRLSLGRVGVNYRKIPNKTKSTKQVKKAAREELKARKRALDQDKYEQKNYEVRNEILQNGMIRCPAFSTPLPLLSDDSAGDSDGEDYGDLEQFPAIVKAKKTWKKLFSVIMDKRIDIPLKQMAIKAKHEGVIYDKM